MTIKALQHILSCLVFLLIGGAVETKGTASTISEISRQQDLTPKISEFGRALPESPAPEVTHSPSSAQPALVQPALAPDTSSHSLVDSQVIPVSQLSDVVPTDWAYQAFASLAKQYGCIVGYPDRRYLGNLSLTRFEFAAGMNACLDRINTLIASGTEDTVSSEDLATLQRLQEDFRSELTALPNRVNALEVQFPPLEAHSFSPTGKINILSSFNLAYSFAGGDVLAEGIPLSGVIPTARLGLRNLNLETGKLEPVVGKVTSDPPVTLSQSTYLIFTFSRTSQDVLTAILAMGDGDPPGGFFSSAGLTSTSGIPYTDANPVPPLAANDVGLLELKYSFAVTDNIQMTVGPRILPFRHFDANLYTDVIKGASGLNFYQSTLANSGLTEAGAIVDWVISPELTLRGGYLARNDAALTYYGGGDGPTNTRRGLFGGTNSILAEVTYSPSPTANIRLLYIRDHLDAPPFNASSTLNAPFLLTSLRGVVDDGAGGGLNDVIENSFVLNFDWQLSSEFALFGRYSYSIANIDPVNSAIQGGEVNLQAFQLGMAFPDLGKPGALGTLAVVVPFDEVSGRRFLVAGGGDGGTEIDFEAVYSYPLGDHIALVPTFFATFNSNNFRDNPPVYGTTLRMQFLF